MSFISITVVMELSKLEELLCFASFIESTLSLAEDKRFVYKIRLQ